MALDRTDLRPYQERMVQHIKDVPNNALWVDMGLGKTVSTLTAVSDLRESLDVDRTLIIAPLRVARKTWADEIKAWEHLRGLTVSHIIGTEKQRLAGLNRDAHIHTINRENVVWLRDQLTKQVGHKLKLIRKWPWDNLVIDESSSFKSQTSQRWKALRSVRRFFDRCTELTGTPAPNGYKDLWAQIHLLDDGKRLGFTEKAFKDRWMDPPSRYDPGSTWAMKPGSKESIERQIADIIISMQAEDYLDLPEVMINPVRVQLSNRHMTEYKRMERNFVAEIEGKRITAVNAGVLAGKLMQLANGAVYYDDKGSYQLFHDHKLDACIEILEQSQGPVLLAYNYASDRERLAAVIGPWCEKHGKRWALLKTEEQEDQWNNDEIDVLLLHPQSAGHGLNMHKGSSETIIWYGLTWSLEAYQQLNARLAGGHRCIGKNVVIHLIISEGTIDDEVIERITYKHADQQGLMDALKVYIQEVMK